MLRFTIVEFGECENGEGPVASCDVCEPRVRESGVQAARDCWWLTRTDPELVVLALRRAAIAEEEEKVGGGSEKIEGGNGTHQGKG